MKFKFLKNVHLKVRDLGNNYDGGSDKLYSNIEKK